jgi:hypothetical protein
VLGHYPLLVIAIVLNPVEEARGEEAWVRCLERAAAAGIIGHPPRLAEVEDALADLEAELAREQAALSRDGGGE